MYTIILSKAVFSHSHSHSHSRSHSRCFFGAARICVEDAHSKTVQSLTAFGDYTGIFPLESPSSAVRLGALHGEQIKSHSNPHSLCTSLSLRFLIHQITSTAVAACIGYCWAYLHPYPLSHTLPMADNAKQLVYAYWRVAG